jgi:hypothetical protein
MNITTTNNKQELFLKEKKKTYNKAYKEANKEKLKEQRKIYNQSRPVSSFEEHELEKTNVITNLQPLWATDNLSKGYKYEINKKT